MSETAYMIRQAGPRQLNVIDAMAGVQVGIITPRGDIEGTWVVSGNRVSFVVRHDNGSSQGFVYGLPSCTVVNTFRV